MGGLAALPVVGKFFKGAKVASKIPVLKNTTTTMPAWFPDLVDKFIAKGVGKKIDSAKSDYSSAMNKLVEGKGNLISRVERIKKMGAKAKKSLPESIIKRATDDDLN